MPRRMYDSVDWQKIPADARMVAGYVDGAYAWPEEAWRKFPDAAHVRISVIPPGDSVAAGVLDVESGAASVDDAPGFIRARRSRKEPAVIYVERSLVADIRKACGDLDYGLWVADWTGKPHKLTDMHRVVAVQWSGGADVPYDISEVFARGWHPQGAAKVAARLGLLRGV